MSKIEYLLVSMVLLCGFALAIPAASYAVSQKDPLNFDGQTIAADPAAKEFAKSLGSIFIKKWYEINNGYPMLYSQTNCDDYTYPIMKNCYLNNPAAPYVMPVLKTWPDEYIDPATVNAFGKTPLGYTVTYRLDPNEAILIFGKLPPRENINDERRRQSPEHRPGWVRERLPKYGSKL